MKHLKEQIKEILINHPVNAHEYQDKFYLVKELKTIFPKVNEDNIYKAIEYTNYSIRPPRNKKKYVDLLTNKLVNFDAGFSKHGI